MLENQNMINQINGIIYFLSMEDKKRLPEKFISFFSEHSNVSPKKIIDPSKSLKEQNLSDDSILMLAYINKLLSNNK